LIWFSFRAERSRTLQRLDNWLAGSDAEVCNRAFESSLLTDRRTLMIPLAKNPSGNGVLKTLILLGF